MLVIVNQISDINMDYTYIEQNRKKTKALKSKVKSLSGKVKKLKGDNNALLEKICSLHATVNHLADVVGFTVTDVDDPDNKLL